MVYFTIFVSQTQKKTRVYGSLLFDAVLLSLYFILAMSGRTVTRFPFADSLRFVST